MTKKQIKTFFAILGGKTSPAKARAARLNGKKGGRPKNRKAKKI
jgi:hypothetical protein